MNELTIVGNLTDDPAHHVTGSGRGVARRTGWPSSHDREHPASSSHGAAMIVSRTSAIAPKNLGGFRAPDGQPGRQARPTGAGVEPAPLPHRAEVPAAPVTGQLALIFDDGKLASDYSAQAAASMLQKSPFKFKTEFVGPGHTALTAQLLQQAKLFVHPGGEVNTDTAKQDLAAEIPLVNQFVNNGGRYLGLCAGGFVAGKEGYGVFPGEVGSYAGSPGTVAKGSSDQLIPVLWGGKTVTIDWDDGNYFNIPAGTPGVTVMGTYTNGLTAAAVAAYGKGKSAFIGPHVESGLGSNPPDAASLDLGFQLLQVLMN